MSPEARGGAIAQDGFRFQDSLVAARIPGWMRHDAFDSLVRETHGDVEARFYVPGSKSSREFVEYKDHELQPKEFWGEIEHFLTLFQDTEATYQEFVVGCRGVSPTLRPLAAAHERLSPLLPFYDDAAAIESQSLDDFIDQVKKTYHGSADASEMAKFLLRRVVLETQNPDANRFQEQVFTKALIKHFPVFAQYPAGLITKTYRALIQLLLERTGIPIERSELEHLLFTELKDEDRPVDRVRFFTVHDKSLASVQHALRFPWAPYFQVRDGLYPPVEAFARDVSEPLVSTRHWIMETQRPRQIELHGHRRLSVAYTIGHAFPAVAGFTVKLYQGSEWWSTQVSEQTKPFLWKVVNYGDQCAEELVLGVGVIRDVTAEVETYVADTELSRCQRVYFFGAKPFDDPSEAMAAAEVLKNSLHSIIGGSNIRHIHLFMGCPSFLAMAMGHTLNLHLNLSIYERINPNVYQQVAAIAGDQG